MRTLLSEPQRLILVALAIVLLIPFGLVFWRLVVHQPRSTAEREAELQKSLRDEAQALGRDDEGAIGVMAASSVELVGLPGMPSWVSFYPRRWVGIVGFIAIGVLLVCLVASLFVSAGLEVWTELASEPQPPAVGQ